MRGTWRRLTLAMLACLPMAATLPPPSSDPLAGGPTDDSRVSVAPLLSEPPAARPEPPRPRQRVTIALTGDVLIHNSVWDAARTPNGFDFEPLLRPLNPTIQGADLALCHLEVPLADPAGPFRSYPQFSAPPQVAEALAEIGYDGCSTASNHAVDQGYAGLVRTLDTLDAHGLAHTGTARTPAEAGSLTTFARDGLRIGWLSYTYGTNGLPVDPDKPWSVNLISARRIVADARRARRSGADAVLVALHWGTEYRNTPDAFQQQLARRLARSPAITVIYGHHAHVVQPIRKLGRAWVIFGLGNSLADQATVARGVDVGLIAEVTLVRSGNGPVRALRPTYRPTLIDTGSRFRVWDVERRLSRVGLPASERARLEAARDYVASIMR